MDLTNNLYWLNRVQFNSDFGETREFPEFYLVGLPLKKFVNRKGDSIELYLYSYYYMHWE